MEFKINTGHFLSLLVTLECLMLPWTDFFNFFYKFSDSRSFSVNLKKEFSVLVLNSIYECTEILEPLIKFCNSSKNYAKYQSSLYKPWLHLYQSESKQFLKQVAAYFWVYRTRKKNIVMKIHFLQILQWAELRWLMFFQHLLWN